MAMQIPNPGLPWDFLCCIFSLSPLAPKKPWENEWNIAKFFAAVQNSACPVVRFSIESSFIPEPLEAPLLTSISCQYFHLLSSARIAYQDKLTAFQGFSSSHAQISPSSSLRLISKVFGSHCWEESQHRPQFSATDFLHLLEFPSSWWNAWEPQLREEEALALALSSRGFSPRSAGSAALSLTHHSDESCRQSLPTSW